MYPNRFRSAFCASLCAALIWQPATVVAQQSLPQSRTLCTLVQRLSDHKVVHRSGTGCDTRYAPASTFKLPLALIGFEDTILTSPDLPAIPYDRDLHAHFKEWRETTTPRRWLQFSVIWYSRWITKRLGINRLQQHIDAFSYGNRDLSGDPGLNNGLTHAWLSSSLQISPAEQIAFLDAMLSGSLPVSPQSIDKTIRTVQDFSAGPLQVKGKTGTGWLLDSDGKRTREQLGWFIGWVTKDDERYVFARIRSEQHPRKGYASSRTKASVLNDLPRLLP